jgi:hypothetical protein
MSPELACAVKRRRFPVGVRPPLTPAFVERIREALNKPGRTEGVRRSLLGSVSIVRPFSGIRG